MMNKSFNILLVCKLSDDTVEENVLLPLLASGRINKIYVLRETPAKFVSDKVEYLSECSNTHSKVRHVGRFLKGLRSCRKYNIDIIIGVLDIPHGFIGRAISMLTHIPYIHMTIAGHREFWSNGPKAEKFKLLYFKNSAAITVTGSITKQYLVDKGLDSNKIFIIPNLPNEAITQVTPKLYRKYDIVSFSRIDANKNIGLLIEALAILKEKRIYPKVAIAGSGDKLDEIMNLARERSVDAMIDFLGFIRGFEAKVDLLTSSRIFVSCSKGEGFPVSLIEAMNCGCVPVVSNVGDIADVVHNDINGYIYDDFNSPNVLAKHLENLLLHPKKAEELAAKAIRIHDSISVKQNGMIWTEIFSTIKG